MYQIQAAHQDQADQMELQVQLVALEHQILPVQQVQLALMELLVPLVHQVQVALLALQVHQELLELQEQQVYPLQAQHRVLLVREVLTVQAEQLVLLEQAVLQEHQDYHLTVHRVLVEVHLLTSLII